MSLHRKLQKWVDANLISEGQREAILAHEQGRSGNLLKHGIGYVGVFSILLGIALIVASNWQYISDSTKLSTHFLANVILAALIFIWRDDATRIVHREGAVFALWGLTLTLIALVGQVFQMGGDTFSALRFWFWITTPLVLYYARGMYITALWAIFFVVYVPWEFFTSVIEKLPDDTTKMSAGMFFSALVPIGIYLLGGWQKLILDRPAMAKTFRAIGIIWAVACASGASFIFYAPEDAFTNLEHMTTLRATAFVSLMATLALWYGLRRVAWLATRERPLTDIVCFASAMMAIPYIIVYGNDMMSMLHFIFLWLGIGYLAQTGGFDRLVNLSILVVTARLFVGFLELFGSMMMSGFGFIVIGFVLMGLLYGARVVKRKLKSEAVA
ncbi:MAG TPA: DUF2157 domain-containing protein [Alphaproteobacteria bacterium]